MNCYKISTNKLINFYLTFFIVFFYFVSGNSHPQDYQNFKKIEMEILKDGKVIGFNNYLFNYKDQILQVENKTQFEVKLLGVKVFSIKSNGIEKYDKNQLISFNSQTFQNEKKKFVNLKVSEDKKKYKITGSSFSGYSDMANVIGNWWNHDILEASSQISPLSGSIKEQVVTFVEKKSIVINKKKYSAEHYKLRSKDPNTPENKKLNFDIWYSKKDNLILKIVYNKMGRWEYKVRNFEKYNN